MISRLFGYLWNLSPRVFAVNCQRAVPVSMRDGIRLATDVYHPRGIEQPPAILIRSPYGRGTVFGLFGRLFAERGYTAIVQSVRGTFDSGGRFNPFFQERADGVDTVEWIEQQPWYGGKLGLHGASYLGQVQWAIAGELGDRIAAMVTIQTTSDFHGAINDAGGFRLEDFLRWASLVTTMSKPFAFVRGLLEKLFGDRLGRYFAGLPLRTLDQQATGEIIEFWRTWLDHDLADPMWKSIQDFNSFERVTAPVKMLAGWSDVFIKYQLRDFKALRSLDRTVHLKVGP
jgi:uncharacterized protein